MGENIEHYSTFLGMVSQPKLNVLIPFLRHLFKLQVCDIPRPVERQQMQFFQLLLMQTVNVISENVKKLPQIPKHFNNHLRWLDVQKGKCKFVFESTLM